MSTYPDGGGMHFPGQARQDPAVIDAVADGGPMPPPLPPTAQHVNENMNEYGQAQGTEHILAPSPRPISFNPAWMTSTGELRLSNGNGSSSYYAPSNLVNYNSQVPVTNPVGVAPSRNSNRGQDRELRATTPRHTLTYRPSPVTPMSVAPGSYASFANNTNFSNGGDFMNAGLQRASTVTSNSASPGSVTSVPISELVNPDGSGSSFDDVVNYYTAGQQQNHYSSTFPSAGPSSYAPNPVVPSLTNTLMNNYFYGIQQGYMAAEQQPAFAPASSSAAGAAALPGGNGNLNHTHSHKRSRTSEDSNSDKHDGAGSHPKKARTGPNGNQLSHVEEEAEAAGQDTQRVTTPELSLSIRLGAYEVSGSNLMMMADSWDAGQDDHAYAPVRGDPYMGYYGATVEQPQRAQATGEGSVLESSLSQNYTNALISNPRGSEQSDVLTDGDLILYSNSLVNNPPVPQLEHLQPTGQGSVFQSSLDQHHTNLFMANPVGAEQNNHVPGLTDLNLTLYNNSENLQVSSGSSGFQNSFNQDFANSFNPVGVLQPVGAEQYNYASNFSDQSTISYNNSINDFPVEQSQHPQVDILGDGYDVCSPSVLQRLYNECQNYMSGVNGFTEGDLRNTPETIALYHQLLMADDLHYTDSDNDHWGGTFMVSGRHVIEYYNAPSSRPNMPNRARTDRRVILSLLQDSTGKPAWYHVSNPSQITPASGMALPVLDLQEFFFRRVRCDRTFEAYARIVAPQYIDYSTEAQRHNLRVVGQYGAAQRATAALWRATGADSSAAEAMDMAMAIPTVGSNYLAPSPMIVPSAWPLPSEARQEYGCSVGSSAAGGPSLDSNTFHSDPFTSSDTHHVPNLNDQITDSDDDADDGDEQQAWKEAKVPEDI
ncbi:hypothetical protein F5Y03DRAFT_403214 [Xylaria venustula]|nr:hypothetical protein F5Y03DRAFT_403214 [Xylaria venustula]